ncbi:MAG: hypothetical protein AAF790_10370 [Planctomycetota bacterium]
MNMNEMIDRFCDSPRRWLIVTAVTFVVGLATVLPQVDQYLSLYAEEEEQREQLEEAVMTAGELPMFRKAAVETEQTLAVLEARTLPAENLAGFRSELVNLVRESGCQVRRIAAGNVQARAWREEDTPLAPADAKAGADTAFQLETRPVSLSISGGMNELRGLLTRIEKHKMMMHARSVDIRPAGRDSRSVQMELELWCFALIKGDAA